MQNDIDEMKIHGSQIQRIGDGVNPVEYNYVESFSEFLE